MENNKERALELIDQLTFDGETILKEVAVEIAELASKPNWFHPNELEVPPNSEAVWCKVDKPDFPEYLILYSISHNVWITEFDVLFEDKDVVAWSKLPKYNENE